MRQLVGNGGDDARLAVVVPGDPDAGHAAQRRLRAVGGDHQRRGNAAAVGKAEPAHAGVGRKTGDLDRRDEGRPLPSSAASSACGDLVLGTRWAKGSPGATSPSNLRNSGREMSPRPESVIFICRIGSAPSPMADQTPSCSKTRRTPAASAEARWSCGTVNGRRSTSATDSPRIERISARASVSPAGPPPTMTISNWRSLICQAPCFGKALCRPFGQAPQAAQ